VLRVVEYPDPVLKQACLAVEVFDSGLATFVDQMVEAMYASGGVGLAAPQVGASNRILTIDPSGGESNTQLMVLVNPSVTWRSAEAEVGEEGCLSLPGVKLLVPRSLAVDVEYFDLVGVLHSMQCRGLQARIVQHEVDHLDGVMMLDRVGVMSRKLVQKHLSKNKRGT
jgi:peptide deformylase